MDDNNSDITLQFYQVVVSSSIESKTIGFGFKGLLMVVGGYRTWRRGTFKDVHSNMEMLIRNSDTKLPTLALLIYTSF